MCPKGKSTHILLALAFFLFLFMSDLWHQLILLTFTDSVSTRMNQEAFVSALKAGLQ